MGKDGSSHEIVSCTPSISLVRLDLQLSQTRRALEPSSLTPWSMTKRWSGRHSRRPSFASISSFVKGPAATEGFSDPGGGATSSRVARVMNSRASRLSASTDARSASPASARSTAAIWPSLASSPGRTVAGCSTWRKTPESL